MIGSSETIAALTLEEARRFHARWYGPDDVTVVVAGNLDPEMVRAVAARTFGAVEARSLPPRSGRGVPEVEPGRFDLTVTDAQVKRRTVRYARLVRIPEQTGNERYARLLLADFLASRLAGSPNDVLVEGQGVTDGVGAGVTRLLPGLYAVQLSAEPTPETTPEQLADAMRSYLDALAGRGPFDAAILERLKRRFAADAATAGLSGERVMNRVVEWVANGDPYDSLADVPRRVAAVTPDDVSHLLTLLQGPGRELVGILLPEPNAERR
ncbi:MAG: insulinase family protein, partial [Microvirga sp.]